MERRKDHRVFPIAPDARLPSLMLLVTMSATSPAWGGCSSEIQASMPVLRFQAPADDLVRTVSSITLQAKFHYLWVTAKWEPTDTKALAVSGKMTLCEALERAMKGTGYDFGVELADRNVVIYYTRTPPSQKNAPLTLRDPVTVTRVVDNAFALPVKMEEVMVTGSYLRDVNDVIAPIIHISNSEMSQASFASVQDALYNLPLNSLSAPREDLSTQDNAGWEAGVNLRGLGSGATLILMNGHRLASSGLSGSFTDISKIPSSVVERIEVLTDGASAQYGSDAIAGVVNIMMRKDFDGAETQFRVGGTPGGRDEDLVSQLFGKKWDTGNILLGYEFTYANPLPASARGYAADANKQPYGGGDYRSPFSNPGNVVDPTTMLPVYGVPTGQNGLGLTNSSFSSNINLENQFSGLELFPERRMNSGYVSGSQSISDEVHFTADAYYSRRETSDLNVPYPVTLMVPRLNPYFADPLASNASSVLVDYSFSRDFGPTTGNSVNVGTGGTAGFTFKVASDWIATISENYSRDALNIRTGNEPNMVALNAALADPNPATAFDPFGDGSYTNPETLAAIRTSLLDDAESDVLATNAVLDGSIARLPGGEVKLAIGGEHRREEFSRSYNHEALDSLSFQGRWSRGINAAFAELGIPLVANRWNHDDPAQLELTLSGRYERYTDFGTTVNPQARLRWVPFRTLKLRGSWARSFRAPTLDDLYDTSENISGTAVLPDPKSPTGQSVVVGMQGTNPGLKPERATTWTAGVDWIPETIDGLTVSLTYYSVEYRDQVAQPADGDALGVLVNESEWAGVITRNPTRDQVLAICNRPDYYGSRTDCYNSSPAAIVDLRLANLGVTQTQGVDVDIRQVIKGAIGQIAVGLRGTEVFRYDQAVSSTASKVSVLDTFSNPVSTRWRNTVEWSRNELTGPGPAVSLAFNYTGGYRNPASILVPRIASSMTVDGQVGYRTARGDGWLDNTDVTLNVVNLLNQSPPFTDWMQGYDWYNTQPLGRVTSLSVRRVW